MPQVGINLNISCKHICLTYNTCIQQLTMIKATESTDYTHVTPFPRWGLTQLSE